MTVICFGDSNTFGYDPRSYIGGRYDADARWVDILAAETGWEVRNNGMNGREVPCREVMFSRSADLLIIMLGTNDLLHGRTCGEISARMEHFLSSLTIEKSKLLLIAPPALVSGDWVQERSLIEESASLASHYSELSERLGIDFVDAGEWRISLAFDGVHFTEEGNREFASELCGYLRETGRYNL